MEERHFGPVWFLPGDNNGKYPYCNSVYIAGQGILIDPASNRERLARLREENGVREIWLSHWHEDHFMHLDLFDDLPLAVSEQDAAPLASLDRLSDAYGLDHEYREHWHALFQDLFHFKPRVPSRHLRGGTTLSLEDIQVEIIAAPGHTPGHLAFLFKGPDILFLGDYDLTPFGPWYGDVASSISSTIDSVRRLQRIPAAVWLCSHEEGVFENNPGKLWDQYLQVIDIREEKLLHFLREARSMEEIVDACIIYRKKREPKAFFEFGERALMRKHLEKLLNEKRIVAENGRFQSAG
ncbi:MAG: MBL fold metallo-hydrolase [Thermodesulfobacteriota bacterium]